MREDMWLFLALTAALAALAYIHLRARKGSPTGATFVLAACAVFFCGWSVAVEAPAPSYTSQRSPLVIAVAFDLSPSMLAVPNPQSAPHVAPRFERARRALVAFLDSLEEERETAFVSLIGFTRTAEILTGWDQNAKQIREVLQYGVTPELFGSSGTSMESAVSRIDAVFNMLPDELKSSRRKLAIIVSDGEDTSLPVSRDYALHYVANGGFDLIALQAGMLDAREGVPAFGRIGEFLGFQTYGGKEFTVPNVEMMTTMAASSGQRGLYVRAEDQDAAARMLEFAMQVSDRSDELDLSLLASLGMFSVIAALCICLLK